MASKLLWKMLFVLSFVVIVMMHVNGDNTCTKSNSNICEGFQEIHKLKYTEETNGYLKLIQDAVLSFVPCVKVNCSCHSSVIDKDLSPFKSLGITNEMIDSVKNMGTRYQIIDHRLYRDAECMFPARCAGVEYFVNALLPKLPDMELVVNTRDWPQVSKRFGLPKPVFSFSKTAEYYDILYPTWGFWKGGPAIKLYPQGLGRWDLHRSQLHTAAEKWPWGKKLPLAFFRGSRTSNERDFLVLLSRERPDLVDAQYTKNQAWKSDANAAAVTLRSSDVME